MHGTQWKGPLAFPWGVAQPFVIARPICRVKCPNTINSIDDHEKPTHAQKAIRNFLIAHGKEGFASNPFHGQPTGVEASVNKNGREHHRPGWPNDKEPANHD